MLMWCGVVWCGGSVVAVWCGVVFRGVVWCDVDVDVVWWQCGGSVVAV